MAGIEDHERVYAWNGRYAHLLELDGRASLGYSTAVCGFDPAYSWRGTGSQDEYDRAASLPLCPTCAGYYDGDAVKRRKAREAAQRAQEKYLDQRYGPAK